MFSIGFRATPGLLILASTLAVCGVLTALSFHAAIYAVIIVPVVLVAVTLLTWKGTSLPEWWKRRQDAFRPLSPIEVASRDRAAITWDSEGETATTWLELFPENPLEITTVKGSEVSLPKINISTLASLMTQGDIVLSRIGVISMGYGSVLPTDASHMVMQITGKTPTFVGGRTFISVSLTLSQSHTAISARAINRSYISGTHKAVLTAAARIRIMIEADGIQARLLTPQQLEDVSRDVLTHVGDHADDPQWASLGAEDGEVVSLTPRAPAAWTQKAHENWVSLPVHRTYENMFIERARGGSLTANYSLTYATHKHQLDVPAASHLAALGGQQIHAVSHLIPLAASKTLQAGKISITDTELPFPLYPGGLGVYLGPKTGGGDVFIRIPGSGSKKLYIIGPPILAHQILLRLSVHRVSVDIRPSQKPEEAHAWKALAQKIDSPLITYDDNPTSGVVIVGEDSEAEYSGSKRTVIVLLKQRPIFVEEASITARGGELVVSSGSRTEIVEWTMTKQERDFLDRLSLV